MSLLPVFSVVGQAAAGVEPKLQLFGDSTGTNSLAGQIGLEYNPMITGYPELSTDYDKRLSIIDLKNKAKSIGLFLIRASGCKPGTTYYYRVKVSAEGQPAQYLPADGTLSSVTTAQWNSLNAESRQLILTIPGTGVDGRVVKLTSTNAPYPLASVVGDGCL